MARVKIGSKASIPLGGMVGVDVEGKKIVVFNVNGEFHAMNGICTHAGGHLWEGKLINETTVKCPRHGSEYDIRTGKVLHGPRIPFGKAFDLKTYPVTEVGDELFIEL
jgi:3-phenylpropionate/trans-cinnamate dioxygenase ferredoxin component